MNGWKREAGCRKFLLSETGSEVLIIKLNILPFYKEVFFNND
jgi:hypothetical protein